MTKTLKSLRRVKEKGVTVIGPALLIILKDSIITLVILLRFVTYTDCYRIDTIHPDAPSM